jgi:threonine synthase
MNGIWSYKNLQNIDASFQLTLNEGSTPIRKINIEGLNVVIKDENSNPNGSFKDRSLAYQIAFHMEKGTRSFVISSSGNAGVSAAAYAGLAGVKLDIFVSDNINTTKLAKLELLKSDKIVIHVGPKPKSDAIKFASTTAAYNLRGSADDAAIVGFKTIAYELIEQYPDIDSIFLPCSSGTSAMGIYQGFIENGKKVKIYICQTSKIHSIASRFDRSFVKTDKSFADAITDRVSIRKMEVINAVKESEGSGFVINDALLYQAKEITENAGLFYSYNSLLGLAGLLKARAKGIKLIKPVILASGL